VNITNSWEICDVASEWIQSHSCASLIPCFKILKKIFDCGYGGYIGVLKFKVQQ
jgi:hypothetical protein